MATSEFLQSLIESGPDAQGNLYKATFTFASSNKAGFLATTVDSLIPSEELSVRLTKYNSPSVAISTVSLPYQNLSINIPTVSSTLDNKLNLTFRMDDGYSLYKLLIECNPLKSSGAWGASDNEVNLTPYIWNTIKIEAYSGSKATPSKGYDEATALSWEYHDCKLLDVPSISYGYSNAQAIEVSCNFTYSYCSTLQESYKNSPLSLKTHNLII